MKNEQKQDIHFSCLIAVFTFCTQIKCNMLFIVYFTYKVLLKSCTLYDKLTKWFKEL